MAPRFGLYSQSPETREYLEKIIGSMPQGELLENKPLEPLPGPVNPEADVVLVEYQEDNPLLDRWIEKVASDPKGPPIFLYLKELSTDSLRKALRLGVRECFSFPIKAEEFQEALTRLPRRAPLPEEVGFTQVISFLGCKGGVGNSFLAANVASLLARGRQEPVLLVDLDLRYGQIVHFFDAKPKYTIIDVVESLDRSESGYLESLLHPCDKHLSLLPAPPRIEDAELVTPAHLEKILNYLKNLRLFRWILVDCCHQMDEVTLKALEMSDELLLVATPSIPALANAKKLMEVFQLLGLDGIKLDLWLNYWQKQGDMSLPEVESFLGRELAGTVSFDSLQVGRSINEGRPLTETAPKHPVCRDLKKMVSRITGAEQKETARSFWSRLKLFGRKG
jgi:pilus assembly protein CpaE